MAHHEAFMTHKDMKDFFQSRYGDIVRYVGTQYKRELANQRLEERRAENLAEMEAEYKRRVESIQQRITSYKAQAQVSIPDGIDPAALGYVHTTLTQQWRGMTVRQIEEAWEAALTRGDKITAWVFSQHAPYVMGEKSHVPFVNIDGIQRSRPYDGSPYTGGRVDELQDKTLQFAAPDAHKSKHAIPELEKEQKDLEITHIVGRNVIKGLQYSESDGVVEGFAPSQVNSF